MLRNLKKREGFTLIELMIVVAIIGILAAIAIPNFIKFQLRAKAGEAKVNLAAIRTSEESYFAEAGTYVDMTIPAPAAYVLGLKTPFTVAVPPCPAPPIPPFVSGLPGNCWMGWQPEGDVYYSYQIFGGVGGAVAGIAPAAGLTANEFYAGAVADIDADGVQNSWGVNQPDQAGAFLPSPGFSQAPLAAVCGTSNPGVAGPNGPLDSGSGLSVVGQVGPCDSIDMGRNVF
jgi:type IV pilus assembly protein PilA